MTTGEQTIRALFGAIDSGDFGGAAELLTDDVHFQLGNAEPTIGRDGFAASATQLQTVVASISHDLHAVWTVDSAVICEMSVTYERHDGRRHTLPCANVFRLRDERIADYRIYMDVNPVLAP